MQTNVDEATQLFNGQSIFIFLCWNVCHETTVYELPFIHPDSSPTGITGCVFLCIISHWKMCTWQIQDKSISFNIFFYINKRVVMIQLNFFFFCMKCVNEDFSFSCIEYLKNNFDGEKKFTKDNFSFLLTCFPFLFLFHYIHCMFCEIFFLVSDTN